MPFIDPDDLIDEGSSPAGWRLPRELQAEQDLLEEAEAKRLELAAKRGPVRASLEVMEE